jgi:hypothetical protein
MADLRSVDDRLTHGPVLDATAAHTKILALKPELVAKIESAFPVTDHPAAAPYRQFGGDGGLHGSIRAITGGQLDWGIDSFIADPARGFCNHHLTLYLGAETAVPHLGFAIGTIPELFFFVDLVPRSDLWTNVDELDRYHAKLNAFHLEVLADPRWAPFTSREPYIRVALSPVGLCLQGKPTVENIERAFAVAHAYVDRWLAFVREAEPVAEGARAALAARDALVRRTICERDPANVVAEKVFGKDMTDKLVRLLWGADRKEHAR